MRSYFLTLLFLSGLLSISCNEEKTESTKRVVIGIPADAESLNPLFSFTETDTDLSELLYPGLFKHEWNNEKGIIETYPLLAKAWEWNTDSSEVTIYLREDIFWRDNNPITAEDIVFSFDIYSDPDVQSRFLGTFDNFYLGSKGEIDIDKSFKIISPRILKISFNKNFTPDLYNIDLPIIPKHIFSRLDRKNTASLEKGIDSVTSGPFYLYRWDKNQSITLRANEKSFLYKTLDVKEVIFRIIPDYNSRITHLKRGEIDLVDNISLESVDELQKLEKLKVEFIKGKDYDYIGWNFIDPETKKPHNLFSSKNIRLALSYAVNRGEILNEYLMNHGELAAGPVSPIFKEALNNDLKQIEYSSVKAKELLAAEGWSDKDRNGVIEKNGREFRFTISIPAGNPRRQFASTIVKNNLKSIGIEADIQSLEPGVFFDKMFSRELEAWMAGWSIQIPLEVRSNWYSDLENTPSNVISFKNNEADRMIDLIEKEKSEEKRNELLKEFQEIIYSEQAVTFLYWIDNIFAYNKRITNLKNTPLGPLHNLWEYKME